jgi:hypothetical protein
MAKDDKLEPTEELLDEEELVSRRDFLVGLGKWSKIVIGLALLGGTLALPENEAAAAAFSWNNGGTGVGWANRRGGGWSNRYGGGGWANGGYNPGWNNKGGGGWNNRGGGGTWGNRVGGGGWANRRGGGGWLNRR